ncbi:hypothetical protein HWV01_12485 [Moritella sp. 5]|uniref:hypothetical protein n=1 Tax=Moritella sp. 5 TaxID=2746231 RepID=UPI001BA741D4|nr:hypothetical protein [Moritella sp. 5]QUM81040.1 hypothetical protein HWV01_12485 [Moritella sp. 5]
MIKNKKQQLIYLVVTSHSESTVTVMLLVANPDASPYSLKLQQRNEDCVSESDLVHFYDTPSGYHYSLGYVK